MDYNAVQIPYGPGSDHINAWLHPSTSRTLVLLVHGHNSFGDRERFITLANTLQAASLAVCRFTVLRTHKTHTYTVTTVSEEVRQAKVVLHHFKPLYDRILVVGHSQGGMICLDLALHEEIAGVVFLMSVVTPQVHVEKKLHAMQLNIEQLRKQPHTISYPNDTHFTYTADFFDDFTLWDIPRMLTHYRKPVLFIAGSKDTSVTAQEVRIGFQIANIPKDLFTVEDEHNFSKETAILIGARIIAWTRLHGFN